MTAPERPAGTAGRPDGAAGLIRATLRGNRRHLAALAAWSAVEAVPPFVSGHAVARALDTGFLAGRPHLGLAWLGGFAAAAALGALATGRIVPRLGAIVEPLRDALVRRVVIGALRQAAAQGRPQPDGAVPARLTQQVELVRDSFAGLLMVVRDFAFTTVSALAGVLTLLPAAAALVAVPVLAAVLLFARLLAVLARRQHELVLADERVAAAAVTVAEGVRDAVACGAEETVAAAAGAEVAAQAAAARRVTALTALSGVCLAVGGWLPVLLILAAAPWLLSRGAGPGELLGTVVVVLYGVQPALHSLVRGLGGTGLRLVVTLRRLLAATAAPPGTGPGSGAGAGPGPRTDARAGPARAGGPRGHALRVRGLRFAYGPQAAPVLRDVDLDVPEGDHLAVVGPSGTGKSTFAALLAGVLPPQAGTITLGGVPLDRIPAAVLARRRVLVPQEAYVFTGTLGDNLRYLHPGAPVRLLEQAAAAVGLPYRDFDAPLDGAALSAGERQLIALARAYLSPARLVILDEATCHLDPAAEARVEEAFAARPGTLIVVAHRMSSALRARRVLVLDGETALVGGHAELLAASPLYRDLVGHWTG